jgi:hypothetical protein
MAYVPGFEHDVFVSYAHGDNRAWIDRVVELLKPALKGWLGIDADIYVDDVNLRRSLDYRSEIPEKIASSAAFLFFASPTYLTSHYCIHKECVPFERSIPSRRDRFATAAQLVNSLFAVRCKLLPIDNNEHWSLLRGLTDVDFCDANGTFSIGSPAFETSLRALTLELVTLLKCMRNNSTPVFLYPPHPETKLKEAHAALQRELSAESYRILPDREVHLDDQLREASLSVFLLGADHSETAEGLAQVATEAGKPWLIWPSSALSATADPTQAAFGRYLQRLNAPNKTYLSADTSLAKLKEEVLALLKPDSMPQPTSGKPRVYLVYNRRQPEEVASAGQISRHFRGEFHFDFPDNPALHTRRLSMSDGVLIVWGRADEDWCSREFRDMLHSARAAKTKGLCLFDPRAAKETTLAAIRRVRGIHIAEQFGTQFDPDRMEPFFEPIRREAGSAQV